MFLLHDAEELQKHALETNIIYDKPAEQNVLTMIGMRMRNTLE